MKISFLIILFFTISLYSQKNTEVLRIIKPDGFYNLIDFGVGYQSGNSNYIKINGTYRLDYVAAPVQSFFIANIEYKEGNEKTISDNGFLHLRSILKTLPKFDIEVFLQKEYDEFILLQDRQLAGIGIRHNPINYKFGADTNGLVDFSIATGLMYEYELFGKDNLFRTSEQIRSTSYASLKIFVDKVTNFSTVIYFQPSIKHKNDYRILNETRVTFNIYSNFSIFINTVYRYDNDPELTIKDYDFELTNGISVKF